MRPTSQAVSTDGQSASQAAAKVASDRQTVSSAQAGLAGAQASLTQTASSATVYGQSSAYTELPAVGQIVKRGETLYAISGEPVVLLYGSVAPWRAFLAGMPPGKDVAELNANLRALGYGSCLGGEAFTPETSSAIDAFQAAHGLSQTGELLLGSVVFEPGPVRVTAVTPTLGATVQAGPVLDITSLARQVTIELDAAEQSDLKVGDPVTITLPDNSTTPGKVSYVGTVATVPSSSDQGGGGSSTPTIEVDVTPTDPAATGRLDQAPVNVSITTGSVNDALVVPVNALLALASGGYAVEVAGAGGARHLVAVNLGLFDDARRARPGHRYEPDPGNARGGAERMSPVSATDSTLILPAPAGDGSPETVLELDDVSKVYGSEPPVVALDGVSFSVHRGELLAIVGPSGSGKSTLLHLMGTLDRPSSGTVRITGLDVAGLSDRELAALRATRIGFIFQQFFLAEHATALENVADGLLYAGVPVAERREQAAGVLAAVGLGDRLTARPTQLSGGERQRVAIARALIGRKAIVLADEPTGNLDSTTGAAILALLHELHAGGATIAVITHDRDLAAGLPRQVEMLDGRIVTDTHTENETPR